MDVTGPQSVPSSADDARRPFVAYEYKTLRVPRDQQSLYTDCLAAFGWDVETFDSWPRRRVTLKLKRNRDLPSRAVLTELQNTAERALGAISSLARSRTVGASAAAYAVGLISTALIAGSVFAVQAELYPLTVVIGVLGLVGWVIAWFVYRFVLTHRSARVAPVIAGNYDTLYDSCARAARLLA